MPVEIKAYSCEHGCGKFLKTRAVMIKHEARCLSDTANRTCKTCEYDFMDNGDFVCGADVDKNGHKIVKNCRSWVENGTGLDPQDKE